MKAQRVSPRILQRKRMEQKRRERKKKTEERVKRFALEALRVFSRPRDYASILQAFKVEPLSEQEVLERSDLTINR